MVLVHMLLKSMTDKVEIPTSKKFLDKHAVIFSNQYSGHEIFSSTAPTLAEPAKLASINSKGVYHLL